MTPYTAMAINGKDAKIYHILTDEIALQKKFRTNFLLPNDFHT